MAKSSFVMEKPCMCMNFGMVVKNILTFTFIFWTLGGHFWKK